MRTKSLLLTALFFGIILVAALSCNSTTPSPAQKSASAWEDKTEGLIAAQLLAEETAFYAYLGDVWYVIIASKSEPKITIDQLTPQARFKLVRFIWRTQRIYEMPVPETIKKRYLESPLAYFRYPLLKQVWERVKNGSGYSPDFREYVDKSISSAPTPTKKPSSVQDLGE